MWLQHLFTSLLYCKQYQDSGIKYNLARVESSTVPPKLPKKWAAAAASRYPVMMAATCKYLEQDCTMIVPCTSHNHSQIFYRGPLSVWTTALAQLLQSLQLLLQPTLQACQATSYNSSALHGTKVALTLPCRD